MAGYRKAIYNTHYTLSVVLALAGMLHEKEIKIRKKAKQRKVNGMQVEF